MRAPSSSSPASQIPTFGGRSADRATYKLHTIARNPALRLPKFGAPDAAIHRLVCNLTVSDPAPRVPKFGSPNAEGQKSGSLRSPNFRRLARPHLSGENVSENEGENPSEHHPPHEEVALDRGDHVELERPQLACDVLVGFHAPCARPRGTRARVRPHHPRWHLRCQRSAVRVPIELKEAVKLAKEIDGLVSRPRACVN